MSLFNETNYFDLITSDIIIYSSSSQHPSEAFELSSAIIPWLIGIHNSIWCIYFFHTFGICTNKYVSISVGMKRSASFLFITHSLSPIYFGLSNFDKFIQCRTDFIIQLLLYALAKLSLFIFFTFRVDVILRDSFFEYKRLQSWLLRIFGLFGFIMAAIYFPLTIHGNLDYIYGDVCILDRKSFVALYIAAAFNAVSFSIVIIIFARKICQVTHRYSDGGGTFAMVQSSNDDSFKLIETLQYHTLLIALNVIIEMLSLSLAIEFGANAICMSLSIFCDVWCVLLMFRRIWFRKYCNFCLIASKMVWRYCCGVKLPQIYFDDYDLSLSQGDEIDSLAYHSHDYDVERQRSAQSDSGKTIPFIWRVFTPKKDEKDYRKLSESEFD